MARRAASSRRVRTTFDGVTIATTHPISFQPHAYQRSTVSLGRDVVEMFGEQLDTLLDIAERLKASCDRVFGNVLHNIRGNVVAKAVEIVDELAPPRREEQPVGAAVLGIMSSLEQTMFDKTIEQSHQGDRLQLEHICEIDLRQSFLSPQSKQHDPLRARRAAGFRAMIDIVAQQSRAFRKLHNKLPFQFERHKPRLEFKAFQKFRIARL